jgi:ATP-dependent DNA ligase
MSSSTTVIKNYPVLYKKDKSDKVRIWNISAVLNCDDNTYWIKTEYGQKDGKIIVTEKEITEGKNIGKKNETTIEKQLVLVCDKTFKDKKEKEEYIETLDEINDEKQNKSFCPMLADKWDPNSKTKRKIDITFPCFIQPKLDGIRCLSYLKKNEIVNQSRQLKYFKNLDHINKELDIIFKKFPDLIFDGELYNHDIVFNKIAGIVKTEKLKEGDKEKLEQIQYHIYDCFVEKNDQAFSERFDLLQKANSMKEWKYLKFVPTLVCKDKDEVVNKFHPQFIEQKFEGSILRNKNSVYEFNRTKHLQKFKTFEDDEFEIINFKEGTGHDLGTVVWKCKTKSGKEFDVRPIGTVEERSELFKNAPKLIGKMLTVTYQELSEFGVPRFPVGKNIRDYE